MTGTSCIRAALKKFIDSFSKETVSWAGYECTLSGSTFRENTVTYCELYPKKNLVALVFSLFTQGEETQHRNESMIALKSPVKTFVIYCKQ